jgi:hypothetical protein
MSVVSRCEALRGDSVLLTARSGRSWWTTPGGVLDHREIRICGLTLTPANAVQAIYGVGRIFVAVFVAEIGDVTRFDFPQGAVLMGRTHPETQGVRPPRPEGRITKQGSRLVRWAAMRPSPAWASWSNGLP